MDEQLTNYQLFQQIKTEYNWMRIKLGFPATDLNDSIQDYRAFDQIDQVLR